MSSADLSSDLLPLPPSVDGGSGSSVTGPPRSVPRSRPLPARDLFGGGGGGGATGKLPSRSLTRRDVASTLFRLAGRPAVERIDALRAGGSGGGDSLVLVVLADDDTAVAAEDTAASREVRPGLTGSGEVTKDTGL